MGSAGAPDKSRPGRIPRFLGGKVRAVASLARHHDCCFFKIKRRHWMQQAQRSKKRTILSRFALGSGAHGFPVLCVAYASRRRGICALAPWATVFSIGWAGGTEGVPRKLPCLALCHIRRRRCMPQASVIDVASTFRFVSAQWRPPCCCCCCCCSFF